MNRWDETTLVEVCELITDGTHFSPVNASAGDFKYITSKNIRPYGLDLSDLTYVSAEVHTEIYRRCPPKKGDVLYVKDGVNTGTAAINTLEEQFSMLSSVALLRPKAGVLDAKYLVHWLASPDARRRMMRNMSGTAIRRLILQEIKQTKLPLPPIAEQQHIAAILDRADAVRRKRQEAIALTEELLRSVFLEMFGDPATNPKGWEVVLMKDVVSQTQYGTAEKANSDGIGIPVLRMNNITYTGEINLDNIKWCSIASADKEKFTVQKGDLLFNRTNSPELVGKTAVWRSNEEYAYAGYLVRVRFKKGQALSEYVSAYLNSSYGKKYLFERAKPSNNMSNFSASEFLKIPLPLPPFDTQQRFVQFADATRSSISRLEELVKDADNLFDSLLQTAFQGKL